VALIALPGVPRLTQAVLLLLTAALIQLRLLANMLDGMVAVQTGRASPLGELFNEVPDRVSDFAVCVGAGYAAGGLPELGFLAACVALFVAYVRAQGKAAGARQEFCGPMAKQQRMAAVTAACAAAAGLSALDGYSGAPLAAALALVVAGAALTALRRLRRIAAQLGAR
jgi:phosphatidylglycerophosphate synthase